MAFFLLPIHLISINIVYGSIPISDYFSTSSNDQVLPYNLIDTNPSCFYENKCPMFPPGGKLSAFPNSEEKYQHLLNNLHRMHSDQSLTIDIGKYTTDSSLTTFCDKGCSLCGTSSINRKPLYWYSDANQAARFKQWDESTCNQTWYQQQGQTQHSTCKWGTEITQFTGSGSTYTVGIDRCSIFSDTNHATFDCSYGRRAKAFCHEKVRDECWFFAESICFGNDCVLDQDCETIFGDVYDYIGKGYIEGTSGADAVFSRNTKEISYLLPIAAHYDERMRISADDQDENGKYFTLMLEYFDGDKMQKASNCWALYDGEYHEMDVVVSNRQDYSIIFKSNFDPPTSCQPYAFICKTSLGNFVRLPEEDSYYFGTEWLDLDDTDIINDYGSGYKCKENHYYYNSKINEWIVNGGPTLKKSDIWYYDEGNTCIGCQYIDILDCWENCIYSDFDAASCDCDGSPFTSPTPRPTAKYYATPYPTSSNGKCSTTMDCDDGLYCNGYEYCENGKCFAGSDVKCGFAFVCDEESKSCKRECDSFDIDGYLQCSESFANVEGEINTINDKLDDINGDVQDLETKVNGNQNGIYGKMTALQAETKENNGNIGKLGMKVNDNVIDIKNLNDDIAELRDLIDKNTENINGFGLGYNSKANANVNPGVADMFDDNDEEINNKIHKFTLQDIGIFSLIFTNILLLSYICICSRNNGNSRGKYSKVVAFSDGDISENCERHRLK